MPSIRQGKPMLSPNGKPFETTRKSTNYSYGKTFTCKGNKKKNTLNKVGKAKYVLLQWYALSNSQEASETFHYSDTPTCEGATNSRQGRKASTSSKVKPYQMIKKPTRCHIIHM